MRFAVAGLPETEGSMIPRTVGGKNVPKRTIVVPVNAHELARWRSKVRAVAVSKVPPGWVLLDGPIELSCTFLLARPRPGQKGINVAWEYPIHQSSGDVDKLARSVGDALTGVVWTDDSRVIDLHVRKRYPLAGQATGVLVEVKWIPGYAGGPAGEQLKLEE